MATLEREAAEAVIGRVLLDHWHLPTPEGAEPLAPYGAFAHDLYNLLVRGASDVQVERHLRHIEADTLHQPELAQQDLGPVVRSLRDVERAI